MDFNFISTTMGKSLSSLMHRQLFLNIVIAAACYFFQNKLETVTQCSFLITIFLVAVISDMITLPCFWTITDAAQQVSARPGRPYSLMTKQPCPLLIQLPGESRHRSSLTAQTHLTLLNTTSVHSKFITGRSVCKELNLESRQNCCHKTCSFDILRHLCTISDEEKWVPTLSEKHLSGFELTISI